MKDETGEYAFFYALSMAIASGLILQHYIDDISLVIGICLLVFLFTGVLWPE
jgi:hypothetical protein